MKLSRLLILITCISGLIRCMAVSEAAGTHNFATWEKEISAFEQSDKTNHSQGIVLFIGSSTIRMWDSLAKDFPEHHVLNRGFGGSEILDCTHFADRIIFPYKPSVIFLRSGGNDLHNGKTVEQVFQDYKDFVAKVHSQLPQTEIVYISLCPSISRWKEAEQTKVLNTKIEEFTRSTPGLKYIECYSLSLDPNGKPRPELFLKDMLHFNADGYKLLANSVRPYLPKTK